jgi:hypothetical protein
MIGRDIRPDGVTPGQLEEIEWTVADEAPPPEPFRWLVGDDVPARVVPYDAGRRDPTGVAGVWLAIEGLSGRGRRPIERSPISGSSPA